MEKICLVRPIKENLSQIHDFWNFWCVLGRSAGVILECRITVCNYSVELSIQKSQPSTVVTTRLLCVLSSSRLMFHISNLNTPGQPVLYEGMEPKQKISNRNKMLSSLENLQSSTYSTRRKYYTI